MLRVLNRFWNLPQTVNKYLRLTSNNMIPLLALFILVAVAAVLLLIIGGMGLYESDRSPDDTQNTGLLVVSGIVMAMSTLGLLWLPKLTKDSQRLGYPYLLLLVSLFGMAQGILGAINSVDTPNNDGRGTALKVLSAVTTTVGAVTLLIQAVVIAFMVRNGLTFESDGKLLAMFR